MFKKTSKKPHRLRFLPFSPFTLISVKALDGFFSIPGTGGAESASALDRRVTSSCTLYRRNRKTHRRHLVSMFVTNLVFERCCKHPTVHVGNHRCLNPVCVCVSILFPGPRTHRMPPWIRTVFLYYLPACMFMKRPKKTRLRWMMEMPGMSGPPHPEHTSPSDLPAPAPPGSATPSKHKMEAMELSDLHHPNCKINQKAGTERRESESSDSLILSPEASKATEAVEFIAEHLRNEDQYIQVIHFVVDHSVAGPICVQHYYANTAFIVMYCSEP